MTTEPMRSVRKYEKLSKTIQLYAEDLLYVLSQWAQWFIFGKFFRPPSITGSIKRDRKILNRLLGHWGE